MTSALGTLAYFEYRRLVHRIETIRKSPGRAVMWIVWLGFIGFFFFVRSRSRAAGAFPVMDARVSAVVGGVYLAVFGLVLANARASRVAAFDSLAEARFMALSAIPPVLVVAWIQFRSSIGTVIRLLFSLIYLFAIIAPRTGISGTTRYVLGIVLATYALGAIALPVALARGGAPAVFRAIGYACVGLGAYAVVCVGIPFLTPDTALGGAIAALPSLPLGPAVVALVNGAWPPFLGLLALAAAATALAVLEARDAYPELYEMTIATSERLAFRRGGGAIGLAAVRERLAKRVTAGRDRVRAADGNRIPGGAWVLVWREWLVFRRSRSLRSALLGLATWYALGAGVGLAFAHADHRLRAVLLSIGASATFLTFILAAFLGQTVALDLRKPLFWLAGESTFARLSALIASGVWRFTATVGGMFAILFFAAGQPALAVAAPFVAAAILVLLLTVGYALYAILPRKIDQSGPLAMVRVLLAMLACAAPSIVTGLLVLAISATGAPLPPPIAIAALFGVTAAAEGALLLLFAAWRIERTLDVFAAADV